MMFVEPLDQATAKRDALQAEVTQLMRDGDLKGAQKLLAHELFKQAEQERKVKLYKERDRFSDLVSEVIQGDITNAKQSEFNHLARQFFGVKFYAVKLYARLHIELADAVKRY